MVVKPKYGRGYYSATGRLQVLKRWGKLPQAVKKQGAGIAANTG